MSNTTNAPQVGDIQNGHVLTEAGAWVPMTPPKKKHTVRNVILVLLALSILGFGGCMTMLAMAGNEVAKSIDAEAKKPGGDTVPLTITPGKAFEVDGFNYAKGWKVKKDALGDAEISGLKVTNNRETKDSALVDIKFWKGTEVLADVMCTSDPIAVGTTVTLSCIGTDPLPKGYDKVTINDTF